MFSVVFGLLAIIAVRCQDIDNPNYYYTAAVYEYVLNDDYETDDTTEYILKNLEAYEKATSTAARHNADIVIFPEYGIFSFAKYAIEDSQYVPDPKTEKWNPCLEPNRYGNSYILVKLSCMAKENNIVVLANILSKIPCNDSSDCPESQFYIYNTNVAFNRSGLLIARYRKTHLYYEDRLKVLPEPEFIVFETDFATIGIITCFDIVWKEAVQMVQKYKPDAVAFLTLWMEFFQPGMNILQIQQSWGITNNVTILTSNRQQPKRGIAGSGVFFGDSGIGNYVYIPDGRSRLLVSKVPKRGVNPPQDFPAPTIIEFDDREAGEGNNISSGVCSRKILHSPLNNNDFRCTEYNLKNFTLVKVESEDHVEACNNGLCCHARYKTQLSDEDYYLAVINGTYTASKRYTWWLEACFLLRCDPFEGKPCSTFPTKSDTVFQELKLEGNFTTEYVYPSISISGMHLPLKSNWVYNENGLYFKTKTDKLLYATLYGRSYNRDPKHS